MRVIRDPELGGYAFVATGPFDLAEASIQANIRRTWYTDPLNNSYWMGKHFSSWPEVMTALKTPDPKLVDEVRAIMEEFRNEIRELPQTIKRKRSWNKNSGNVSVSRAIGGNPNFMYRFNRQKHTGPKNVVIVFNSDAFGSLRWEQFRWGGIATCAVVDLLEDAGYCCEVWIEEGGRSSFRDRQCPNSFTAVPVKGPADTLDLDLMAKVFSPWYLRTAIFGAKLAVPEEADRMSLGMIWPNIPEKWHKYLDATHGVLKVRIPLIFDRETALAVAISTLRKVTTSTAK